MLHTMTLPCRLALALGCLACQPQALAQAQPVPAAMPKAAGQATQVPTRKTGPKPAAQPLPMRLSADIQPKAYALALTVDPAQPRHSGVVDIDVQLRQPSARIRLHAKDLTVQQAWAEVGARRLDAKLRPLDASSIELVWPKPLPAGPARLTLHFSGLLQDKDVYGLFRQQEAGRWMAATQFESTGARLAFPLFDEPGWKLPWALTLTVPEGLQAVANMPLAQELPARPGWKTLRFETTPPLPSYLLAFAVGNFDIVDAGLSQPAAAADSPGVSNNAPAVAAFTPTPLRFITPAGRGAEAAFAAASTGAIVQRLEAFFDQPHPFPKLDSLALPVTVNFGAMENAGLITYASTVMLAPPGAVTPHFRREYVALAAHELAHQWFGNLVTMAWWDDLWLNESFASWLGDHITHELQPGWGFDSAAVTARRDAMRTDRLQSSRRIAEPVRSDDELANVWDSITYQKGQAVLAMIEQWLGPDRFRAGVRRYMARHAWGSATAADFSAALALDDPALPDALRSFTHQAGIPRVAVDILCSDGPPRLRLRQSRLLALGSVGGAVGANTADAARWQLPMVVRTPGGSSGLLLTETEAEHRLPDATCPAWVQANEGGLGYYRPVYAPGGLAALLAQPGLPVAERLAALDDAQGLAEAGDLALAVMLDIAEGQAGHADRRVVALAAAVLAAARPLIAPAGQADYAARWQRALGPRARSLGWLPRPDDSEDDALLRASLLPRLAELGQDEALRGRALEITRRWLTERSSLPGAQREAVLQAAALAGDEAVYEALQAALLASSDRPERQDLLLALGHFRDPALAGRARQLLLNPQLDIREARGPLMRAQATDAATRQDLLRFVQAQHAALVQRLGRDEPAWLPSPFARACSTEEARQIEAVFAPLAPRFPGGQRALAQALEEVRLCTAWREAALR